MVFIDLEAVISEEKKRIFSRVLHGELSREEAEDRVGRFFIRFGEVLVDYEKQRVSWCLTQNRFSEAGGT